MCDKRIIITYLSTCFFRLGESPYLFVHLTFLNLRNTFSCSIKKNKKRNEILPDAFYRRLDEYFPIVRIETLFVDRYAPKAYNALSLKHREKERKEISSTNEQANHSVTLVRSNVDEKKKKFKKKPTRRH